MLGFRSEEVVTSTYDVFISYSRHDVDFAVDLERTLSSLSVYRDQSTVQVGDAWFSALVSAIYSSRAVVVLLSAEYISSPICRAELFHALGRDPDGQAKIVLPVLIKPVQLPDVLRLVHYFDATKGQPREDVLSALRSAITAGLSAPRPARVPPEVEEARLALAVELNPDAKTLVRVLRMARRALANLEVRAAAHTTATLPPTLEIELEDKREEVRAFEERLRRAIAG
ncbi:toll/interleukin-1 receptor domain-containing protein [Nonomuraea sp. H19]|uniref:toll/interleukin-1 receptor domain-containing protein n=1 Tax=Nonomuraea sp. H19 TaxID=3452206 RepID=UPI003F8A33B6